MLLDYFGYVGITNTFFLFSWFVDGTSSKTVSTPSNFFGHHSSLDGCDGYLSLTVFLGARH